MSELEYLYYEDLEVGEKSLSHGMTVSHSEILQFAKQYDPQPIHVNQVEAAESMFEGLIASGWHTTALCMRLLVDAFFGDLAGCGARGVDELRWKRPVRPGDTLRVRTEVLDKKPWKGNLGQANVEVTAVNQDDQLVLTFVGLMLFKRRNQEG